MKIRMLKLTMRSDKTIKGNSAKLRGFFATEFNNYILLHQHDGDKLIYKYPLVQYKIIDYIPVVLGIKDGVEVLIEVYNKYENINLGTNIYEIVEKEIKVKEEIFGIQDESFLSYTFLTPWLALNEKNYQGYQSLKSWKEKKEFLAKILTANIISMSKGLDYTVPVPIKVELGRMKEIKTSLKGIPMIGFLGDFKVNFQIPDYWGIGKSVSRGFGTVKRLKGDKYEARRGRKSLS